MRRRLDAELVRRKLARSREQAGQLIADGRVRVGGQRAAKAATQVEAGAAIVVEEAADGPEYVSRGGHKLAGALKAFPGLEVKGRTCLDAGASTGGFTDVLLRAGAAHVYAVDVGYGQIAWSLRTDDRVTVMGGSTSASWSRDPRRPAARPGRRRPVVHLAEARARAGASMCRTRRRLFGDGEASVRGREGPGRRKRCGPRPGAARGRRAGRRRACGHARPGRPRGDGEPAAGAVRERGVLPLAAGRCSAARRRGAGEGDQGRPQ